MHIFVFKYDDFLKMSDKTQSKFPCVSVLDFFERFKSSHLRCSVKKGVLGNFAKFTGKHLCQRLF